MEVRRTRALVKNTNPRKEGQGDEMELASDVSLNFIVESEVLDTMVGAQFTQQFFSDSQANIELEELCPIRYERKMENLRAKVHIGKKTHNFEPATIQAGASFMPVAGGYLDVNCKLQVHPTKTQSGELDSAVKEWVEVEIEPLTGDLYDSESADADEN